MTSVPFTLPDRYRVTGHVASGGMAAVYAAHDELLGRDVAVKVLAEHLNEDPGAKVRFQREARAAAALSSHSHVVTIYDVGECGGRSFIVMELFSGGSLADVLRSGREIDRATALGWLRDAASALDAAHAAGVVHRDIKPANLLLDARGSLAIADFGIARLAESDGLTMTGQVLGTASYLSPEQALGETATTASDRYALAVVAFELLTGRRPFEAEHFAAQARAHVEEQPPRASDVRADLPPAVDPVLDRGLAKAPEERWRTATAFVDALEAALQGAPDEVEPTRRMAPIVPTRPAPARPRPAPVAAAPWPARDEEPGWDPPAEPRRRPWAALLGGVLALLFAGGAFAALSGGGGDDAPDRPARTRTRRAERTRTPTPTPTATATATAPATTATPAPTDTPVPAAGGDPGKLNDRGYSAYRRGDYATAIPLLQRAVEACGDSTAQDPCAYALFNLGSSLHRAGRSAEAIPYLERRLAISDFMPDVVRAELAAARAASGQGSGDDGSGAKGSGKGKDKSGKG